ncbi:MAG: hypothetical protein IPM24_09570 [Bryobacterales bacterium]|nr:hypothetical protein [Bryobacterales bacterium]
MTLFDLIDSAGGGAFDALAERLRAEKRYPELFELRTMAVRSRLGLPLLVTQSPSGLAPDAQREYDEACLGAAREVGEMYLADGDIPRAWPYFRAIGEPEPVARAIEHETAREGIEAVLQIAYYEGANPRKGLELILAHHGICRAITCFDHYPSEDGRAESLRMLVDTLYGELAANLRRAIERHEGAAPEGSVRELIAGRDWLFGEYAYYVDTSHVGSVLRHALDAEDPATLERAVELTEYGKRLSHNFQFKGDAPFEDLFTDSGLYLEALLGRRQEEAIAHFRAKLDGYEGIAAAVGAEALVRLLVRLDRPAEAIPIARQHLTGMPASQLRCPPVAVLCQMAGDAAQLAEVSREAGDPVGYLAARLSQNVIDTSTSN